MKYVANENRYDFMPYNYCGNSGLMLPAVSLGLWHNFSHTDDYQNMVKMIKTAFDCGITQFDLANNYGRPYAGAAEENFGKILKEGFKAYRDEVVITTKAGHYMWPGPYGDFGSRKYLISSLDASLKRMGLEYVDIFYHHRMDPNTPLEETMGALCDIVKSGKALYVGISKYDVENATKAQEILKSMGVPCIVHQVRYSLLDRAVEKNGVLDASHKLGMGSVVFSPLAQGILSDKYLKGIPENSRAAKPETFLSAENITAETLEKVAQLNDIAQNRGQTLAQMAISWLLGVGGVTSVLVGASSPEQIKENANATQNIAFTNQEINAIEEILQK